MYEANKFFTVCCVVFVLFLIYLLGAPCGSVVVVAFGL